MSAHPKPRKAIRDPEYMAKVRALPCLGFTLDVHHVCQGWDGQLVDAAHLGEHHSNRKASDDETAPLCRLAHLQMHNLAGPFRGWTKAELRAWREWAIKFTREQVARMIERAA
jgi:hypothetical protein